MAGAGIHKTDGPVWIGGGAGHIRERTIEMGASVISVENVATMHIVAAVRNWGPVVTGCVIIAVALTALTFFGAHPIFVFLPLFILGIGCVTYTFANPPQHYLVIGTSDGRRTHVLSKNLDFLLNLRNLIREKIDTENLSLTAQINITQGRFEASRSAAPSRV